PVTLASSVNLGAAPAGSTEFGYYDWNGRNQDGALTASIANPDGSFETLSTIAPAASGSLSPTVVLQLYNANGQQTSGVAFTPSAGPNYTGTAGNTLSENLLQLGNGDLVAVYTHGYASNFGVGYQAFTAGGALNGSGQTLVANTNGSSGYSYYGTLTITGNNATSTSGVTASLVGGNEVSNSQFAVAYQSNLSGGVSTGTAGTYYHSYLQLVDETGGAVGAPVNLSKTTGTYDSLAPSVAALKEGGVVVVWASDSLASNGTVATSGQLSNFHLYEQTYTWSGATSSWVAGFSTEQRVDTNNNAGYVGVTANSIAKEAAVVGLEQGGYVEVWGQAATAGGVYSSTVSNIYAQEYDAAGNAIGTSQLISSSTSGQYNYSPTVSALADGGYAISWVTSTVAPTTSPSSNGSIVTAVYNADATLRSVGDTTPHPVTASYMAASADGATLAGPGDVGGGGVHTLSDGGHIGVTLQGAGNDLNTIVINNTGFASIDGGANGHNTLSLGASLSGSVTLNTANIHNIGDLNMGNNGASLTLNTADVLNMTPNKILTVEGGSNSALTLGSGVGTAGTNGWSSDGTVQYHGTAYHVYTSNLDPTAHVWVQTGVSAVTVH
ncbi:hypothetical protein PQR02_10155, partial [Paraburkholderia sediminicola]